MTALGFSTIFACHNRLASSIAPLPKHIMEQTDQGMVKAVNHPVYHILKHRANKYMSSSAFWKKMAWDMWQYGESFAKIERDSRTGYPIGYIPWHKYHITIEDINGIRMVKNHHTTETVPYDDVLHFVDHYINSNDRGLSRAMVAGDLVSTALSHGRFSKKFYQNGTFLGGYLSFAMPLKPEQMKQNIDSWNENYGGVDNSGKTGGVDSGGKFERLNMDNTDAQHNESLLALQKQVAAIYGMPPHKVGIHDNATFSNIAEQNIEYATDVIHPVVTTFQEEHDYKCLHIEGREDRFTTHFDLKGMLKGNPSQRAELYRFYMDMGILDGDDILALEDMKGKGDAKRTIQTSRIPIEYMDQYAESIIAAKTNKQTANNNTSNEQ
jgi:HK97 family phage portal protein